jgi:hypothetical protein
MRVTKEYLKQVIKESIEEVAGGSKFEIVGLQRGSDLRVVVVKIKGKDVEIAFHKDGGCPLVSHPVFFDLDAEQRVEVMNMARKAAGVRGGFEDYSEDEIKKMMSGGKVSSFKDELEEAKESESGSDSSKPSSYAATIDKKYTAHFYRDGKVAFEGPDGKVDATTVTRLKNTNKFRDAKERAKKAGYGG